MSTSDLMPPPCSTSPEELPLSLAHPRALASRSPTPSLRMARTSSSLRAGKIASAR